MDFLLFKFPPENNSTSSRETGAIDDNAALPKFDVPIQMKNEPEDVVTIPEVDDPIIVKNEAAEVAELPAEQNATEPNGANGATDEDLQFDLNFGAKYGFTEINVSFILKNRSFILPPILNFFVNCEWKGYRWYFLGAEMVCLHPDDIKALKGMANTEALDSKFISLLLSAIFGDRILKDSSAGGRKSNFNDVSHKALNEKKLKFIKGIFLFIKELIV